jgi:hypothetical protein
MIAVLAAAAPAGGDAHLAGVIDRMDREMSGLLDSYLEAVPECPVRGDTPVRVWLLDLAWLRADACFRSTGGCTVPEGLEDSWCRYLKASAAYLSLFRRVRDVYNRDLLPDSSLSLELESRLIGTDSLWLETEACLLDTYAEEDP